MVNHVSKEFLFLWNMRFILASKVLRSFVSRRLQGKEGGYWKDFHSAGSITSVVNKNTKTFSLSLLSLISSWKFSAHHLRSIPLAIKVSSLQLLLMSTCNTLLHEGPQDEQEEMSVFRKFQTLHQNETFKYKHICPLTALHPAAGLF